MNQGTTGFSIGHGAETGVPSNLVNKMERGISQAATVNLELAIVSQT